MPDLFTCHIVDALELGEDNLVPWNEQFTPDELSDFIPVPCTCPPRSCPVVRWTSCTSRSMGEPACSP